MIIEDGRIIEKAEDLQHNRILCTPGEVSSENTSVIFKGKGNILFLEPGIRLRGSTISFNSDHALVYLSSNPRHETILKIDAWRETTFFAGKNNYFNGVLNSVLSERKNVIIGGDGVFSFEIWIRTADPHILYASRDMRRINPSRSVFIGDHVWLGQNCLILKGSKIGSGSVIAAAGVVANKTIPSNSVWGGNPVRKIRSGVFFSEENVHNYTSGQTDASMVFSNWKYVFEPGETVDFDSLDNSLSNASSADERLAIVREKLAENCDKNRLYLPDPSQQWRNAPIIHFLARMKNRLLPR